MDSTHHLQPAAPAHPRRRRPRQPVKRPRTIRFALTDEEFSQVAAAADRAGLAKGAFAAQATLIIARNGTTPSESPLREALGEFIRAAGLVRRIGVNLNQAVAKLNATGQRSGDLLPYAAESMRRAQLLDQAAEEVLKRIPPMIGKVGPRGSRVSGLIYYLFGPGRNEEHADPHIVAGWRHPAELEPPLRDDGHRDFRHLTGLLQQPQEALGDRGIAEPVWHCSVRAAPGDRMLSDDEWAQLACDIMHRTGLAPYGQDDDAVRWVAVRHAADHIHLVAMLARQDGTRPRLWNDYYQVGEACRAAEQRFGLRQTAPRDRTAARRPTRAESEKARRHGFQAAPRVALRRAVSTAAAAAASEQEFFARLDQAGVLVRKRFSTRNPGEVTGYAVALTGDTAREGGPVWFGGGKLAADLTLPKLRCRWDPARTRAVGRFTAAERNAIWEHAARTADAAARNLRFTSPDDPAAADAAWAAADTLHAAAAALGSRLLRQAADSFDRAARAPYGRVPPVVAPDGISLRRSARLLSLTSSAGDETIRAQLRLVLQLSRLVRAVADLREAQRHAAQAAAARQAAEELRAAWRASTPWSSEGLASVRTAAERVRLDFPFPPGPVRPGTGPPAGAHRSGPRPSYRPPTPSRRGPGR